MLKIPVFKKNIPQYLYHLTGKNTYANIVRDGFIRTSKDRILNKSAVFTIEPQNYSRQWEKTIIDNNTLKNRLLEQVGIEKETVALKISTQNLKTGKLFVRNQNKFFKFRAGLYDNLPKHPLKRLKSIIDCIHLRYGTPAFLRKFYNRNKAYEYIYKDNISTEDIAEVIPLEQFLKNIGAN